MDYYKFTTLTDSRDARNEGVKRMINAIDNIYIKTDDKDFENTLASMLDKLINENHLYASFEGPLFLEGYDDFEDGKSFETDDEQSKFIKNNLDFFGIIKSTGKYWENIYFSLTKEKNEFVDHKEYCSSGIEAFIKYVLNI